MKHSFVDTKDGSHTLVSPIFGESYHSIHGAIQESEHVFIKHGLSAFQEKYYKKQVNILELGFGTGLNAYLSGIQALANNYFINYVGYEKYPVDINIIQQLNYNDIMRAPDFDLNNLHQLSWNENHHINSKFHFEKRHQDILTLEDINFYDIVYFDAFAPDAQPELWSVEMLERIFRAMSATSCLTTYCAKGQVKRNMKAAGFTIEPLPGPPGKREMTRAWKT